MLRTCHSGSRCFYHKKKDQGVFHLMFQYIPLILAMFSFLFLCTKPTPSLAIDYVPSFHAQLHFNLHLQKKETLFIEGFLDIFYPF